MFSKEMQENKDSKRYLILRSAAKLFAENGYYKTTIEDISRYAGIGKGTVYEYFASKEELFKSIVVSGCEFYVDFLKKQQAGIVGTRAKINGIFYWWLFFVSKHSELQKVLSACIYDQSLKDVNHYLANNFTALMLVPVRAILADGISEGQICTDDLDLTTDLIVGMMFSLTHLLILRQYQAEEKQEQASPLFKPEKGAKARPCNWQNVDFEVDAKEIPEIRSLANQATNLILNGLAPR